MEIKKNLIPNSTQIPNVILDILLPRLSASEGKCILYICRRTFGFHKESDRISFSQFVGGIKDRYGKVLDYGTGLVRASVTQALKNLVRAEAVTLVRKTSKGNCYQINLNMDVDKVVQKLDQSRKQTRSSPKNEPKVVQNMDPQNLGNPVKQSIRGSNDPPVDNRPEFLMLRAALTDKFSLKTTNQNP